MEQAQNALPGFVKIIIGSDKKYFAQLSKCGIAYDLTGASAIKVSHPGLLQIPVVETLANGHVIVVGAAGAGLIQVVLPRADTLLLLPNPFPQQNQDLEIQVTNAAGGQDYFVLCAVLDIIPPPY